MLFNHIQRYREELTDPSFSTADELEQFITIPFICRCLSRIFSIVAKFLQNDMHLALTPPPQILRRLAQVDDICIRLFKD